jgi:adenylate kinase
LERILKKQKEAAIKYSLDQYKEKHREILDQQSQPIRQYLSNNVAEILSDGLAEICRMQPDDPVDALAEYLFKHSLRVPEPNPFSF